MKHYFEDNVESSNLYSDYEEFEAFNNDINLADYSELEDESWYLEENFLDHIESEDDYEQGMDSMQ
jgi:hypothetical protein